MESEIIENIFSNNITNMDEYISKYGFDDVKKYHDHINGLDDKQLETLIINIIYHKRNS